MFVFCNVVAFIFSAKFEQFLMVETIKTGTFKLTAAQRSKRFGKVRSTTLDGTVQQVCTVYEI